MKRIIVILLVLKGLCLKAQPFAFDSTFAPFFDITVNHQPAATITGILEINNQQVMITGDFDARDNNHVFSNVLLVDQLGTRVNSFTPGTRGGGYLFWYNDSIIGIVGSSRKFGFIDTIGNTVLNQFTSNYLQSISCARVEKPYVYPDGSMLLSNSRGTAPDACKIIMPPDTFPHRFAVRIDSTGDWDSSFLGYSDNLIADFIEYDSNRILVSGSHNAFTYYNNVRVNGLCRIFTNGQIDTTFSSPFEDNINGYISAFCFDEDKIVLGGVMHVKGQASTLKLIRLNSDGSLDTSFFNNSQFTHPEFPEGFVGSVISSSDGGYIISGTFDSLQGINKNHLAKLDSNGILEPQFFSSIGPDSSTSVIFNTPIIELARSISGDIYVYGDFRYWDGQPSQPIVRLTDFSVGIRKFEQNAKAIRVYPNPSKDGVIMFSNSEYILETRVYDLSGKLQLVNSSISSLVLPEAKGIYLLQILLKDGRVETHKVIRQ